MTNLKCLVVDDDQSKRDRICEVITSEIGEGRVSIIRAGSSSEAVQSLREIALDLLVIDVNLPIRSGESPAKDGGTKLLKQIGRGTGGLIRPAFVIGITGYEELFRAASPDFTSFGWALLTYSPESSSWEQSLATQCQHVYSYKSRLDGISKSHLVDVCLLTARADTELEAIHNLPCAFRTVTEPFDQTRYLEGKIDGGKRSLRVIAASAAEMGNAAMATLTSKMMSLYRPRVCILAGICAGIDAEIGDIVVGDYSLHYESGKYKEGDGGETVFAPEPKYEAASAELLGAIQRFNLEHKAQILALPAQWPGERPKKAPTMRVGPVASGAAVVENSSIVEGLKFRDRKLVSLEMESYGFYFACRHISLPTTKYVMIKSVCDLARPPKEDRHQRFAAFLSARFVHEFLIAEAAIQGGLFSLKV